MLEEEERLPCSRKKFIFRPSQSILAGALESDESFDAQLMDHSIPVRGEMKYAEEPLADGTWDDRRPIYVRRPEATGALLMREPR